MQASTIFYDLAGLPASSSFSQIGSLGNSCSYSSSSSFVKQAEPFNFQW